MLRLVKLLIGIALAAGIGFVAVTVPFGERTLWGHIKAIAGSKESKKLVEGVKQKAEKVLKRPDARTGDELTPKEREALRKLIRERLEREARQGDRPAEE